MLRDKNTSTMVHLFQLFGCGILICYALQVSSMMRYLSKSSFCGSDDPSLNEHGKPPIVSQSGPVLPVIVEEQQGQQQRNQSKFPLAEIEIVVGHCHDDLRYLDLFRCGRVHIHIYSPCSGEIPEFEHINDCMTVHSDGKDCARETYAFFDFISKRYDNLPEMGAFLQGSAWSENPHVVHDILNYLNGTWFSDLSRVVKISWHGALLEKRRHFIEELAPEILNKTRWLNGWRSQYMASRPALRSIPKQTYLNFMDAFCNKTCGHGPQEIQCGTEMWMGPLYRCSPYLFEGNGTKTVVHNTSLTAFPSDYLKDSLVKEGTIYWDTLATTVTQLTKGNKSILYSVSPVNGLLTCLTHAADQEPPLPDQEDPSTEPKYVDKRKKNGERLYFVSE